MCGRENLYTKHHAIKDCVTKTFAQQRHNTQQIAYTLWYQHSKFKRPIKIKRLLKKRLFFVQSSKQKNTPVKGKLDLERKDN